MRRNGSIIAPLPSLASHIENYYYFNEHTQFVSLYHNWYEMGQNLVIYLKTLPNSLYNLNTNQEEL